MKPVKRANAEPQGDEPIILFPNGASWAGWLGKNFDRSSGVWLRLAKKGSGLKSVSMSDALDVALCFGWITGQAKGESEKTWLARFLPRSRSSIWSRINRERCEALIKSGKMKSAGMNAVELAKRDGRWDAAYDSPKKAAVPPDLQQALEANPRAQGFFESLDSANRYAILFRIQTVKKAETRARKIREFVVMLESGKTLHPPRRAARVKLKR